MKVLYFLSKKKYFKQGFRGRVVHALGVMEGHLYNKIYSINVLHLGGLKEYSNVNSIERKGRISSWLWMMVRYVKLYDRLIIRYAISDLLYLFVLSVFSSYNLNKICLEVNTVHGMYKSNIKQNLIDKIIIFFEKIVLRKFNNLYVVSESSKTFLIYYYGINGNIIVIPNAVLKNNNNTINTYKKGKFRLVYFGSLHPYYDLEKPLEWLKGSNDRLKEEIYLNVYGNDDNNIVKEWVKRDLPIKYMGPYNNSDLDNVLGSGDILLLPYKKGTIADYGSPMKLYEYSIKGLPVLATEFEQFKNVFSDDCIFYDSKKTFIEGINQITSNYSIFKEAAIKNTSRNISENTWSNRIQKLHLKWK